VKLDEEDSASRSVLGDLQQIRDARETGSPSQVGGDVGERNLEELRDHDVAGRERISSADFHVRPLPQPNGARDLAGSNAVSQRGKELHD
jgi:hypothetical protein